VQSGRGAGDVVDLALSACDVGAVLVVAVLLAYGLVADSLGRLADWLRGCVSNDPQRALAASSRRQLSCLLSKCCV
jgi:hypothetical protein